MRKNIEEELREQFERILNRLDEMEEKRRIDGIHAFFIMLFGFVASIILIYLIMVL